MTSIEMLPVQTYRVVNDWLGKTLLETHDFDEACEFKAEMEKTNKHDDVILVAVIDA